MEVDEAEAEVQDLLGEGGLGALLAESGIDDVQLPDTNALDFLPSVPVLPVSVPSVAPTGHAHATASRAPSSGSRASASTSGRGTRDVRALHDAAPTGDQPPIRRHAAADGCRHGHDLRGLHRR